MIAFDTNLFTSIHGIGSANAALRVLSVFLATYLVFVAAAAMIVALVRVWNDRAQRLTAIATYLRAITAAGAGFAMNAVIGLIAFRARPFTADGIESLIGSPLTAKSFPSDHASLAFAVAGTLAYAWPHRARTLFFVATLIAVGRVMAGVHYPTDVLAGAVVGLCWAWIVQAVDVRGGGAFSLRVARTLMRDRL